MIFYKRNISYKLLLRRLSLIVFISSTTYLFSNLQSDYAVLLILLLLLLSIFPVMAVSINSDSIEIGKYYFLGLMPVKWRFHKEDEVEIFPLKIESETDYPEVAAGSDSLLDIFTIFIPKQKITHYTLIIKYLRKNGNITQLQENFTTEEFKLITDFMKEKVVFNKFNNHTI